MKNYHLVLMFCDQQKVKIIELFPPLRLVHMFKQKFSMAHNPMALR